METLGARLKRLRIANRLTAKETAIAIETAESTYREWENGRGLRLPPFQKLSRLFAISVTEIVTGERPAAFQLVERLSKIESDLREIKQALSSRI